MNSFTLYKRIPNFSHLLIIISVVTMLNLCTVAYAADSAANIVKRVEKSVDRIKRVSCSFERIQKWKLSESTRSITGTIVMKKPYMLRVEYHGLTLVIDGKNVWTYLSNNKQVQISDFEQNNAQFPSPQTIFLRYSDNREAVLGETEMIKGMECDIIQLVSPNPEEPQVTVWIDRKLNLPVKTSEISVDGDETINVLSDVIVNGDIEDDVFTFVAPEGVSVIDMRE